MTRLYYCDHYAIPLPEGHKFPMAKYRMVRDRLAADGRFEFECAPLAPVDVVTLVHDEEYVRRFIDGALAPEVIRRIGFPWSEGLVRRTLASVGGTMGACVEALAKGWGGNLAGGTHHAFRGEGSGFCVLNDMAVAIEWLRAAGRIRRAAVVDCDVHQGDGTAAIFENEPEVFTLSLHGERNFPFRKQRSRLDVALADGTGDDEYLTALGGALEEVFAFGPEMVFFQAGVDGLASDTLGRLSLTMEGLAARDRMVLGAARAAGVPAVVVLGGGYAKPVEHTADAHAQTFRTAAAVYSGEASSIALKTSLSVR